MSVVTNSWDRMEDVAVDVWNLRFESLKNLDEILESINCVPLLALCLWHTDLWSVPPATRIFAFISLIAACHTEPLKEENFKGGVGRYVHDVIGSLFTHSCSLDVLFCTLSFLYKGIILEARMGTRRFFNLVFLLAACIGSTKFFLRHTNFAVHGGMYPLLLSLKVIINYTCLFHHPIRFPILHPFLTRRLRFFEFFIALARTRSPQDLILGFVTGTALIAGLNDPQSFIHPLLGEDGSTITTVSTTKLIFRGRSGGIYRWIKSILPNAITVAWLATVTVSYMYVQDDLPSCFDPLWSFTTFDPVHPLTWVVPTHGTASVTHFTYLLFLVYRTPAVFGAAFKDTNVATAHFLCILPMTRAFTLVFLNTAQDCDPFSLTCLEFSKNLSDSCSILLAANLFTEVIAMTPETAGFVLLRMAVEISMIWKFFPEVHLLSAAGAYTAGSLLAVGTRLVDRDRIFLADMKKSDRRADLTLLKNPRLQYGSVTETSSTSNQSTPVSTLPAAMQPEEKTQAKVDSVVCPEMPPNITIRQDNMKKHNIKVRTSEESSSLDGQKKGNVNKQRERMNELLIESSETEKIGANTRDNKRKTKAKKENGIVPVAV